MDKTLETIHIMTNKIVWKNTAFAK
jgi:hypothetical protein